MLPVILRCTVKRLEARRPTLLWCRDPPTLKHACRRAPSTASCASRRWRRCALLPSCWWKQLRGQQQCRALLWHFSRMTIQQLTTSKKVHLPLQDKRFQVLTCISSRMRGALRLRVNSALSGRGMLTAVKEDGRTLKCASNELRSDREIVHAAVKQSGTALQYASKELLVDACSETLGPRRRKRNRRFH